MAEKKLTRKELLKEPDEFLTVTSRAILYCRENPRTAVVSIAVVVIGALVVAGIMALRHQSMTKSHELFLHASRDYENVMQAPTPPSAEQLDKLFIRFDAIAKDYPSYPSGEMALLYSAHVLYNKKDFKGALERYEQLRSSKLAKEGLEQLILYNVAETMVATNAYDSAVSLFKRLSQDTNSPYRREAYASIARIYERTNKTKEAVQAYRQYLKIFPEAPDAAFVKTRIADLTVQS